jgi:5-deoxy-5-amino-3-dehydroquinate synthase
VITVPVDLGARSYPVLVGRGARHRLIEVLPTGVSRAAIVTQAGIDVVVDAGVPQDTFTIDLGEVAKSLETVEELCRRFHRFGLTRADVVVAVGGGVVTDTAGFAAAVYHRGVSVVHVPTTLLGQVDAAIGGKTGVNLPEGKNLVGVFWQPAAVLCDTEVLETLPPREYRSGLGEIAKYHFLDDQVVRSGHAGRDDLADLPLDEKVARCVAIKAAACVQCKADVVGEDEREGGRRAILNYGHTLAHALETAGRYDLRHGEAVAIGLCFAARLANRLGRIDDDRVKEHDRVVVGYGLPTAIPPGHDPEALLRLMARDKKALTGYTFVLDGRAGVEVVRDVARADVAATLVEVAS